MYGLSSVLWLPADELIDVREQKSVLSSRVSSDITVKQCIQSTIAGGEKKM